MGQKAKRVIRYALKKEPGVFDLEKLQAAVDALPSEYTLKMIDRELYFRTREIEWCCDWTAQYSTYEEFKANALGAVVLKTGSRFPELPPIPIIPAGLKSR